MILVQDPEKTVHHIFVGAPGNTFHDEKGAEENENVKKNIHVLEKLIS